MNGDGTGSSWGFSHLANLPVSLSIGATLLVVLILLIVLRVVFADVRVSGSAGAGVGK
jgi:hypothetical protein